MHNYEKYILDLGTGDGRFVYKSALENPQNVYIGIDPMEKQFQKYQRMVNRKKLGNIKFVVGSIESLPQDLPLFDTIYITLPWGSLLEAVVKPTEDLVKRFGELIKPGGTLILTFGYDKELEPTKTATPNMPELTEKYIETNIINVFTTKEFFKMENIEILTKKDIKELESSWAKKLAFGGDRNFYRITLNKGNLVV